MDIGKEGGQGFVAVNDGGILNEDVDPAHVGVDPAHVGGDFTESFFSQMLSAGGRSCIVEFVSGVG